MIVNLELFANNIDYLVIAFFLGDDQLSGWNGYIDFTKIVDKAKVNHNMVLEVAQSEEVANFLRMVVTLHDGTMHFGPDFVRMRMKYETTNGVAAVDEVALMSRAQSYMTMLGALPSIQDINSRL